LKNPTAIPRINAIFLALQCCITITSFFKVISLLVPIVPKIPIVPGLRGSKFKVQSSTSETNVTSKRIHLFAQSQTFHLFQADTPFKVQGIGASVRVDATI
jgi:hypothetical protein